MARGASLYIKTDRDIPAAKGRPFHAFISRQVISLPLFGKDHHHHPDSGGGAGVARGRGGGPGAAARPGRGGRERSALQAALPGYSWHHFPEQKLRGGERGASAGSAPPVTSPGPPARRRGASGARPAAPGRAVMGAARPCACAGRPRERCAGQPGREEAGLRRAKPQPLPAGGDHRSPSPSPPRELPGEPVPTCRAPGVRPPGLRISSEDAGSSFPLPSRRFLFFLSPGPSAPSLLPGQDHVISRGEQ